MSDMQSGTVKFFNTTKGFGFIQPESGNDVFVHISALHQSGIDSLNEGCLLYTSPSPRDLSTSRMPSSA